MAEGNSYVFCMPDVWVPETELQPEMGIYSPGLGLSRSVSEELSSRTGLGWRDVGDADRYEPREKTTYQYRDSGYFPRLLFRSCLLCKTGFSQQ